MKIRAFFGLIFDLNIKIIFMKFYFYLPVLCLSIISCKDLAAEAPISENNYYFENPQPINDSELSKIPNKFEGVFMNSDSVFLNFKENMILREILFRFKINKVDLDSLKKAHEIYNYRMLKDSIEILVKEIDTIFIFSNSQKAKRINGHLILNEKDSIFWKVKMLSLDKNILTIRCISSDMDLKKIDSISKIKSKKIDSTSYIINPSRSEFKKILDLKNLEYKQEFKKLPIKNAV